MNDNDLRFETNGDNTYRATTNLNTAIENPQVNINNAMGINLSNNVNESYSQNLNNNATNLNQGFNLDGGQYIDNNQEFVNSNQYVENNQNFVNNNQIVTNSQELYSASNSNFSENFVSENNSGGMQGGFMSQESIVTSDNNNPSFNNEENLDNGKKDKVVYKPALKQKKKPIFGLEVSKEIKAMAFIIFILLLVVFVIPYVYDFFKELDLVITS